jgi:hypothetical protein
VFCSYTYLCTAVEPGYNEQKAPLSLHHIRLNITHIHTKSALNSHMKLHLSTSISEVRRPSVRYSLVLLRMDG